MHAHYSCVQKLDETLDMLDEAASTQASSCSKPREVKLWTEASRRRNADAVQLKEWDDSRFRFEKVVQPRLDECSARVELHFDTVETKRVIVKRYPPQLLDRHRQGLEDSLEDPWQEMFLQTMLGEEYPGRMRTRGVLPCLGAFLNRRGDGLLVMEWCPWGDIFSYASDLGPPGPGREAQAAPVLRSLLEAVESLHARSIAHCDISAENALLRSQGGNVQVVLADLAMAVQGHLSAVSGVRGKAMYRAPETLTQRFYDGAAADLFSCGVVAFALATGNYPWNSTDGTCKAFLYAKKCGIARFLQKRYVNIGEDKASVASVLSPGYLAVVTALLDMNPVNRCDLSSVYLSPPCPYPPKAWRN